MENTISKPSQLCLDTNSHRIVSLKKKKRKKEFDEVHDDGKINVPLLFTLNVWNQFLLIIL